MWFSQLPSRQRPETSHRSGAVTASDQIRILVVEDEYAIASALRALLEGEGCLVDLAPTVAKGTELLSRKPNVVILDIMLPDGEGTDILRTIRERKMDCHVVVTTGLADHERRTRIEQLKPDAYFEKPVPIDELFQQLGLND